MAPEDTYSVLNCLMRFGFGHGRPWPPVCQRGPLMGQFDAASLDSPEAFTARNQRESMATVHDCYSALQGA